MLRVFGIVCVLFSSTVLGQKSADQTGPIGIFESRNEYDQFMGGVKRLAYGENGNAELQAMIPMLNDIALNRPVGETASRYGTAGISLGLLADPSVREDIEMMDDQYKQIQEFNREIQRRSAEAIKGLDLTDRDKLIQQISQMRAKARNELEDVLLPKQIQRLKQIQVQALLRRQSFVDLLTEDPVKSSLGITDQQVRSLKIEEQKIERDLQGEIAKLRAKARERLISQLDPSQQAEAKELIGDAFEFKAPPRRNPKKSNKNKPKSAYDSK
jgi:hypothetical protein